MASTTTARKNAAVPRLEQLADLFENAAVGFAITDQAGRIVLRNRAITALSHSTDHSSLVDLLGGSSALLERAVVEHIVDRTGHRYPSVVVHTVFVDDPDRIFWVVRPVMDGALPTPVNDSTSTASTRSAADWAADLGSDNDIRDEIAALSDTEATTREAEITRFVAELPVAIHLIGPAGIVEESNTSDLEIVNFGTDPTAYVGHHIRQIYDDQAVVDNFLNQWDDGTPIINFSTHFLQHGGTRRPVRIFSNSRVVDGQFVNTRCVVFEHNAADFRADSLQAFSFPPRDPQESSS